MRRDMPWSSVPTPMHADDLKALRPGDVFYVTDTDEGSVFEAVVSNVDGDTVVMKRYDQLPVGGFSLRVAIHQRLIYADDPSPYYKTRRDAERSLH